MLLHGDKLFPFQDVVNCASVVLLKTGFKGKIGKPPRVLLSIERWDTNHSFYNNKNYLRTALLQKARVASSCENRK